MERDYYAEAEAIVRKLVVSQDGRELALVFRTELEAEVASLLRKIEIAREH